VKTNVKTNGTKAVRAKRLIDGTGEAMDGGVVVLIEGSKIKALGDERTTPIPAGAEVLDYGNATLMPGLIDCHMHTGAENVMIFKNYRTATFEVSPQLHMFAALVNAQLCLEGGITTIRDLGWVTPWGLFTAELCAVRDAINRGFVPGPRLLVAGWAVVTYSHLEMLMPHNAPRRDGVTADGPWDLRKMVRSQLRVGADLIKTVASGGGGTDVQDPDVRNMSDEEMVAIVDEAHGFHKLVSCHTWTPDSQKRAIRAGVDTLEHCVWADDESIDMMLKHKKPLVPTLLHRTDHAIDIVRKSGADEFVLRNYKSVQDDCFETFKKLIDAGVTIAMGTDLNIDPEMGTNAGEISLYVDLGMKPMEAIRAGTLNAAQAIGLGKVTGSLTPGKYADIIAVAGDPLKNPKVFESRQNFLMVMKEGVPYVDRRRGHEQHVLDDDTYGKWEMIQ
jgi:imidazolonepropionase-like amidohydrolase